MKFAKSLWLKMLHDYPADDLNEAEIKKIVNLFVDTKINPNCFVNNLDFLLTNGINPFHSPEKKPTKSIFQFRNFVNRPHGPYWFLAAYPDVVSWMQNLPEEDQHIFEDFDIDKKSFKDNEPSIEYFEKIVGAYQKTSESFETSEFFNLDENIYASSTIFDELGTDNNLTLIAEITTKFYLELKKYEDKFSEETMLIAAAGILDAQHHIFIDKTIDSNYIIKLARETSKSSTPLVDFILKLEPIVLAQTNSHVPLKEIEETVRKEEKSIRAAIQKTMDTYSQEERIQMNTREFLKKFRFKKYRLQLGIDSKKTSFLDPLLKVNDLHTAEFLCKVAGYFALFLAFFSSLYYFNTSTGYIWLFSLFFFGLIGWGIFNKNRLASIFFLLAFIPDILYQFYLFGLRQSAPNLEINLAEIPSSIGFMGWAILFLKVIIALNAVKATFYLKRIK
jgi:hypothetical protein